MTDTVVLITIKVGSADKVTDALKKVKGVEDVLVVTGPYDIIVLAELQARSKYKSFVNDIHDIEDITRTETCLAI
ncbi:MAG: Lrp/AsnC ligand binding domain-containing protein [Candidatus Thorarchaeota archaeon]